MWIKGNYLFDKEFKFGNSPYPYKPYVGLGYSKVKGPEIAGGGIGSFSVSKTTTEGPGVQVFAGLFHPAPHFHKNVALRGEIIYSAFSVEAKTTTNLGFGSASNAKADAGYGPLGFGFGMTYFFD